MERDTNRPPLKELQGLIEAAGYEVISIGSQVKEVEWGLFRHTGVIDLQIAPASFFGHKCLVPIPAISPIHECAAQSSRQEKGSCQE